MVMCIYSVRDSLAREYAPVFSARNDEVAARMVRQMFAKTSMPDARDFELFKVAEFDMDSGVITPNGGGLPVLVDIAPVSAAVPMKRPVKK